MYLAVRNGLDTASLLRSWGLEDALEVVPPEAGDLAVAWGLTALTGPARGAVTVMGTPFIARVFQVKQRKAEQQQRKQAVGDPTPTTATSGDDAHTTTNKSK